MEVVELHEVFHLSNDIEADKLIEEIRDEEFEFNRLEIIANAKIESIATGLAREREKMNREIEFKKAQLRAYFMTVTPKETKTQKSYNLLSGKLVLKKTTDQIVRDDEKLLDWVSKNASQYIKVKESVDWAELKKKIQIQGNNVITEDGEVVEGLGVVEKPEEFIIKLD